jgi:hypothetical protein
MAIINTVKEKSDRDGEIISLGQKMNRWCLRLVLNLTLQSNAKFGNENLFPPELRDLDLLMLCFLNFQSFFWGFLTDNLLILKISKKTLNLFLILSCHTLPFPLQPNLSASSCLFSYLSFNLNTL